MRVVVQRSKKASVSINKETIAKIEKGLVLLVGFTIDDTQEDIDYMVKKIIGLRIFEDENGKMNRNIIEEKASILSISQFTLFADTKKGNRPSFVKAMKGIEATHLYDLFNSELNKYVETKTGIFGSDMLISLENDGPVTILLDSKNK